MTVDLKDPAWEIITYFDDAEKHYITFLKLDTNECEEYHRSNAPSIVAQGVTPTASFTQFLQYLKEHNKPSKQQENITEVTNR